MTQPLSSDHVNYLIWRYLQERGYGKSAIQLQREWANEDPQKLPFAHTVRPYALVSVIQDGLAYDTLAANAQKEHNAATKSPGQLGQQPVGRRYKFTDYRAMRTLEGRESSRPGSANSKEATLVVSRRRPRVESTHAQTGPPAQVPVQSRKRKLSKSVDLNINTDGNAMDTDIRHQFIAEALDKEVELEEEPQQDPEEEMNEEPALPDPEPLRSTLEIGESIAIQTDELVDRTVARTIWNSSVPGTDICFLEWDPFDARTFMVLGGSAQHVITLPQTMQDNSFEEAPHIVRMWEKQKHLSVEKFFVSSYAKARSGRPCFFAIDMMLQHNVICSTICHRKEPYADRTDERTYYHPPATLLALSLNDDASYLLGCACPVAGDRPGTMYIWQPKSNLELPNWNISTPKPVLDACWIDSSAFAACGEGFLVIFQISGLSSPEFPESRIGVELLHDLDTSHSWNQMRCSETSHHLACVAEASAGQLGIWSPLTRCFHAKENVHDACLTSLEWQPALPTDYRESYQKSELMVTSSLDGVVKLWKVESLHFIRDSPDSDWLNCECTWTMEPPARALAIAFSPDGAFVAAAGDGTVNVWKTTDEQELVAKWTEPQAECEESRNSLHCPGSAPLGNFRSSDDEMDVDERQRSLPSEVEGPDTHRIIGATGSQGERIPRENVENATLRSGEDEEEMPATTLSWNASGEWLAYTEGEKVRAISYPIPI